MKITAHAASLVMANARPNFTVDDDGKRKRLKRTLQRGMPNRRVVAEVTVSGYELGYHATKGFRAKRLGQ